MLYRLYMDSVRCPEMRIATARGMPARSMLRTADRRRSWKWSLGRPASSGPLEGVSTRKVKEITEQLCGHEFSAATISRVTQQLDEELKKFARRPLEEEYPYLVLDARYEKVRQDGVIGSQAVQVAIGINWEGRRCVLAVEMANRESASSW